MTTDAQPVIPATHEDILNKAGFAHLATIGSNGELQTTPVWYDWDGTHVLISQTTGRQKYKNIQRQPVIALSITDPENPYRYLEIRGEVAAIDEDGGDAFINSLAKKYLDQDVYPWPQPGDHRVIVRVRPLHATSM